MSTSVLGPVRLYSAKSVEDREFWALFCALVDFQVPVVSVLNPMLTGLAQHVEKRGLSFLDSVRNARALDRRGGFGGDPLFEAR